MVAALERARPLRLDWRASHYDWLPKLPEARNGLERTCMTAIMFDAAMEAFGRCRPISYSRRKAHYAGKRRYQSLYRYDLVVPAVDKLATANLLEHWKAPAGTGPTGRQSEIKASPLLLESLPNEPPEHSVDPGELVRLRDAQRNLVDYSDTARTNRWRRHLVELNEALHTAAIRLEMPGVERCGQVVTFTPDNALYVAQKSLFRVFNRRRWNLGGRLYGHWVQNCPKAARQHITISGEPTSEPDHAQLHPRLLYRLCGLELEGDAYTVDGFQRAEGKLAWNILLNAETRHGAILAIAEKLGMRNGDAASTHKLVGGDGRTRSATALVEALEKRHAPIARYFGSGAGLKLQNIDAAMAGFVTRQMLKRGIVTVPIHDSHLTPESHQGDVREAMQVAFERVSESTEWRAAA